MATSPPDPHPDSPPQGPSEAPDQLTPAQEPGRESVEDVPEEETDDGGTQDRSPLDSPGIPDGNAGTGGENKVQDREMER